MKALWFMPLTFAGGAEGFALFLPYLLTVITALYLARVYREHRPALPALRVRATPVMDVLPDAQPAF